jgi:hypothetical protein
MSHPTVLAVMGFFLVPLSLAAGPLRAGVARVEITDRAEGTVNDPSYVRALVLEDGQTTAAIITVDAVAIGEIGRIRNDFLAKVRDHLRAELGIAPDKVLVNASHCHSLVRADTDLLTVQAVREAYRNKVPVHAGAGKGHEAGISENRRLKMKDGSEVDMRRAYSMPRDEDIASVGPIDPEIGVLRLDREDGRVLAVLYNFACHPIMGAASGGNTAGISGFASQAIEDALGDGAMALFVQGCAGDINPIRYKRVTHPLEDEPLGIRLGLSVLRAVHKIDTKPDAELRLLNRVIAVPRGTDLQQRIATIASEQTRLLQSLRPTDINFKTFLPLWTQHKLSPDFPSYYSQGYLHDQSLGKDDLAKLDEVNRRNLEAYLQNIAIMERLTRLNVNLALLKKHQARNQAASSPTLDVELCGLRVGDFRLVTFPGELTVEVGLNIKRQAPQPFTFVAGYCNGYIYYLPTADQRSNAGYAQEDCDCLVAPEWHQEFESKALKMLAELN